MSLLPIPKRTAGRPPKWSDQKERALALAAELTSSTGEPAHTLTAIAERLGVPYQTVQGWVANARANQAQGPAMPSSEAREEG